MLKNNYIIADIETGGRDKGLHCITQISAIIVEPFKFKIIGKFDSYIKPYKGFTLEKEALEYSHLNVKRLLKKGRKVDKVFESFLAFVKSASVSRKAFGRPFVVGHNFMGFDLPFLDLHFKTRKFPILSPMFMDVVIDTMALSKLALSSEKSGRLSLPKMCERYEISHDDAHNSFSDVMANYELLKIFKSALSGDKTMKAKKKRKLQF